MFPVFARLIYLLIISTIAATSSISFENLLACAVKPCFPFYASSIGCKQLSNGCFCNQALAPLTCAYNTCNGTNWLDLEQWFSNTCGTPPFVDFQEIGSCSLKCLRDAVVPTFCRGFHSEDTGHDQITRNCFASFKEMLSTPSGHVYNQDAI
jgi:hypothetical protein